MEKNWKPSILTKLMLHPTYKKVWEMVNSSFPTGKIGMVDYGCGNGFFLNAVPRDRLEHYEGYDTSTSGIADAKKRFISERVEFHHMDRADIGRIANPNCTDVVVAIGVIQYMSEAETDQFLSRSREMLRERGILVISCSVNHLLYRFASLYRIIKRHRFISRERVAEQVCAAKFSIAESFERGIFISPLFTAVGCVLFDAVDKMILKTRGSIGPVGKFARRLVNPLMQFEYLMPIDYGYTLFIKAVKERIR